VVTFEIGGFYDRELADLSSFFYFHPMLYLFLIPAISMRLWSEERKSGSIELLLTLPVSLTQAVVAKFLAAWLFIGLSLFLTFPIWITVSFLGSPDHGVIAGAYLGSFLMAGSMLAIGSCVSATTKNQVIAFIITLVFSLVLVLSGHPVVLKIFPEALFALLALVSLGTLIWGGITRARATLLLSLLLLVASAMALFLLFNGTFPDALGHQITQAVATLSLFTHFENISKGVVDLRDLIYFCSLIAVWLYVNIIIIEMKKAS
jgi:ABC-2 type transport system permease protein